MRTKPISVGSRIRTLMFFSDARLQFRHYDTRFAAVRAKFNRTDRSLPSAQYEAVVASFTSCEQVLDQILASLESITE